MPVIPRKTESILRRRDFLGTLSKALLGASALVGLGALIRFLDYQSEPARPVDFDLGRAENYAPGSRTSITEAQAILLHTDHGFLALSTTCPHLGCTVEATSTGFVCPCHNSRFDPQGALVQGPATSSLTALRVEQNAQGHLILHTS
jgi:cytochrome b6-f complex iron-sulfur subunit